MIRPLWAVAGAALLGTAGAAGVLVVTSSGGEEEIVQQVETATPSGSATPVSTPTVGTTVSPPPTTTPLAPTASPGSTLTYTDPTYGYSFEYPADWYLTAPPPPPEALSSVVYVTTFEFGSRRGLLGAVKVDIGSRPNPEHLSLDEWFAANAAPEPGSGEVVGQDRTLVGDTEAIMRTVIFENPRMESKEYYIVRTDYAYTVIAYYDPASEHLPKLAPIIDSFRFTR